MGIRDVLTLGGPLAAWWNMFLAVVLNANTSLMLSERGPRWSLIRNIH